MRKKKLLKVLAVLFAANFFLTSVDISAIAAENNQEVENVICNVEGATTDGEDYTNPDFSVSIVCQDESCYEENAVIYTGSAVKPKLVVCDGAKKLKAGKDYTAVYYNNVNAYEGEVVDYQMNTFHWTDGEAEVLDVATILDQVEEEVKEVPTVVVLGKGNYSGVIVHTFNILPKQMSAKGITAKLTKPINTYSYAKDIAGLKPTCIVKDGSRTLKEGVDYIVKVAEETQDGWDPETWTEIFEGKHGGIDIYVEGIGNYTGWNHIWSGCVVEEGYKDLSKAVVTIGQNIKRMSEADASVPYAYYDEESGKYIANNNKEYDSKDDVVTVQYDGEYLINGVDYTSTYSSIDYKAQKYHIVLLGYGEYAGRGEYYGRKDGGTISLYKKDFDYSTLSIAGWHEGLEKVYTGKPIELGMVTYKTEQGYITFAPVTEKYKNNVNVGTATATYTFYKYFKGSFSKNYKIVPAAISDEMFEVADVKYANKIAEPVITGIFNGKFMVKGKDYTVSYANNKALGTATVTIKGKGNFTGSVTKEYSIVKGDIAQATVTCAKKTFNGKKADDFSYEPAVTVKIGKAKLKKDVDYQVTYENNTNAAILAGLTPVVVVTPIGSYVGEPVSIPLDIVRYKLTTKNVKVTVAEDSLIYNGVQTIPEIISVQVTVDGKVITLREGVDYQISYGKNNSTAKNGASVVITGRGVYSGKVTQKYTLKAKCMGKSSKY